MSSGISFDSALSLVMRGVAEGGTRDEVEGTVKRLFGRYMNYEDIRRILNLGLVEAMGQGIEREDVDDSWFARRENV